MKTKHMRELLALSEKEGTPEFEAEVEADLKLAHELKQAVHEFMLQYLAKRDLRPEAIAPALLHVAAVHLMAGLGMEPADIGHVAEIVAREAKPEVAEVLRRYKAMGKA